jgi:thiol-disulfide isomerase/thioredoxin
MADFWSYSGRLALISGIALTGGCGESGNVVTEIQSTRGGERPPAVVATGRVEASDLDSAEGVEQPTGDPEVTVIVTPWEKILGSAKEAKRVVILDVWSLGCEPCMQEFPGLVALQAEYPETLRCISANIDFDGRKTHPPENYLTEVTNFLQFTKAKTENHICATPSDEVYSALDIDSIPAVLVFDAEGNEVKRFVDAGDTRGFTYEKDVAPFVRQLLQPTETN